MSDRKDAAHVLELARTGLAENSSGNQRRLALAEQQFLVGGGIFVGAIKHLGDQERNELTVDTMSTEALTTSEIEGEMLDRASVQSSIQRHLGLTSRSPTGSRGLPE